MNPKNIFTSGQSWGGWNSLRIAAFNSELINFHPLINTTTISIKTSEFINFMLENNKKIHIFSLDSYSIVKSL